MLAPVTHPQTSNPDQMIDPLQQLQAAPRSVWASFANKCPKQLQNWMRRSAEQTSSKDFSGAELLWTVDFIRKEEGVSALSREVQVEVEVQVDSTRGRAVRSCPSFSLPVQHLRQHGRGFYDGGGTKLRHSRVFALCGAILSQHSQQIAHEWLDNALCHHTGVSAPIPSIPFLAAF